MPKKINLTGCRFGRLLVVAEAERDARGEFRWLCKCDCGKEKTVLSTFLRNGKTTSCGCYRNEISTERLRQISKRNIGKRREQSNNWKGGRKTSRGGYVQVLIGDTGNYQLEHRYVMEQHLGRKLLPNETVHHKNGIKTDNRIDNLELRASQHGPGQSVEDIVEWCVKMLRIYAPENLYGN